MNPLKRRNCKSCSSCHNTRAIADLEWLPATIVAAAPHRILTYEALSRFCESISAPAIRAAAKLVYGGELSSLIGVAADARAANVLVL